MMNRSLRLLPATEPIDNPSRVVLTVLTAVLLSLSNAMAFAQGPSPQQPDVITVQGTVRNSAGEPVADASVLLEEKGHSSPAETKTNAEGTFVFSVRGSGIYSVRAEKSGLRESVSNSLALSTGDKKHVDLVLESLAAAHPTSSGASPSSVSSPGGLEFEDRPNFTVAGVTDWNNTGIHGSDVSLRTSEALAKETFALKSGGPGETSAGASKAGATRLNSSESEKKLREAQVQSSRSFEANYQLGKFYFFSERYREAVPLLEAAYQIYPENQANAYDLALTYRAIGDFARAREQARKLLANVDRADVHRLLGDLDERLGDPLEAVREYERAARLDPSEQNYFEWGTELLLHRADEPAVEVFTRGSREHPNSARMLAGLGAALYAGGNSEEAARKLCRAADLKPTDPAPYLFLGKMEKAAPALLPCSEQKLARFVRDQPGNATGNYYYGIVLWKRDRGSENSAGLHEAAALLEKAVAIDPKFGEAYLQLGILHSGRGRFEQAIRDYKKAIEVSPQLGEPHYRLGLAYRRMGEESKAEQEFRVYEQMVKAETAAIESQRRELRQFLIILKDQPSATSPH
jgi:tetratricopeptide (TPR) repeat protein